MKRRTIEEGLEVMLRADLIEMTADADGIHYKATEKASSFVNVLISEYATDLHSRANWVIRQFEDLSEESLREQMRRIAHNWSEEFEPLETSTPSAGG